MKVLLSVKPEFAAKIFSGEKRFEFRKHLFKKKVETVVVYVTRPVGMIIGEFSVKSIIVNDPESLWEQTAEYSGIAPKYFFSYFRDKKIAYAIVVSNPVLYKQRINPYEKNEHFTPPQSFCYLD